MLILEGLITALPIIIIASIIIWLLKKIFKALAFVALAGVIIFVVSKYIY
ncbi:hypothetical protein RN96_04830 [Fusobacterium polymorphum]|uniref:Uncharacterized protein n=1 Tax=Fusobacterium nucleatum subsp. polymorphum TaxID=76857 RepID=A0A2B7YMF7_FUSNP|nr:hypothetical protein [Fusobacterium polymorphum]PGH22465.1 hypothetical protein RN96_04830 [Fusobacterium polymorphum]